MMIAYAATTSDPRPDRRDIAHSVIPRIARALFGSTALFSGTLALCQPALAQETALSQQVEAESPPDAQAAGDGIVVTASRVQKAGFDAPTPTTIVGPAEIAQGARSSVGEVLNDLPNFRSTTNPSTNPGNIISGTVRPDLRGLGINRTLTLLNGHRFTGSEDLNSIPMNLVSRIEVVTGGASAAWGSGAVAGVANIILNEDLTGLTLIGQSAVSSRGDGGRYDVEGSFGTRFSDGRGHFMVGAQYQNYQGIPNRNSRPNLGSTGTYVNPTYTPTNGQHQYFLARDVNASNASLGGLIQTGVLAGQTFNPDGTLRPFQYGSPRNATTMIGGADGYNTFDGIAVVQPYQRYNLFARASYELSEAAKFWVEGSYLRMTSSAPYFADSDRAVTIRNDYAYLSPTIRNQLAAAGQTSFTLGRWFRDRIYHLDSRRENIEAAVGLEGKLGGTWSYSFYYDHGEYKSYVPISNVRISANYRAAIDAVISPVTNQPVCRVALTNPNTNCVPVNLLGEGNISDAAAAYIYGAALIDQVQRLDATGLTLRGDPFSLWAGPVSLAIGAEARWESVTGRVDPVSAVNGFVSTNRSPTIGSFDVKEGFAEVVVPLLDSQISKVEFNGAARYSDYSNSGGIWSWKLGLTDRLFNDLLLRATYSRDIRSGAMNELFTSRSTGFSNIVDPFTSTSLFASSFTGGNAQLRPERSNTFTMGGSYSPRFAPGLQLSVDYYNIKIQDVITTISAQDIVSRCFNGNAGLCSRITRNPAGAISAIEISFVNLARYETSGVDLELSYTHRLSDNSKLSFRGFATYVDKLVTDDGVLRIESAGIVGDNTAFGTPKWRGTGTISYGNSAFDIDARLRYVGGGVFSRTLDIANNKIASRTYVDLGLRYRIDERMTFSLDVTNLFDREPPLTTSFSPHYDVIGRYLSAGARISF